MGLDVQIVTFLIGKLELLVYIIKKQDGRLDKHVALAKEFSNEFNQLRRLIGRP